MTLTYYDRVSVTNDIHGADGRLLVQAGAVGTICSHHCGNVGVLFDDSAAYVELSGCNQRFQDVPSIYINNHGTFHSHMGRRYCVLASFRNSDMGVRACNEYITANPGATVLAVADGLIMIASKTDQGVTIKAGEVG